MVRGKNPAASQSPSPPLSPEEQFLALSAQLATIVEKLNVQDSRFDKLEQLLAATQQENTLLKEQLLTQDNEITVLKDRINNMEQRNRDNSIRVFNMPIDGDDTNPSVVANQLYVKVLLPILQGAVVKGRLPEIPSCDELIEVAHILPSKKEFKPIICRFYKKSSRTLIMQLKKEFAPRTSAANNRSNSNRPPPYLFSIFEDITRDTFSLMRALSAHEDIAACWAAGGQLRFRLKDEETVHRIQSVYESMKDIIKKVRK